MRFRSVFATLTRSDRYAAIYRLYERRRAFFGAGWDDSHETHLSAEPDSPVPDSRVSGSNEDAQRASCARATPGEGPGSAGAWEEQRLAARGNVSGSTRSRVRSGWRPVLRRADFLVTTGEGRRVDGAHFLVFIRDRNDGRGARLGITVTRKVGNAVIRNRIKRLVREWFRSREAQLGSRDLVMIAHRGVARDLGLAAVEQDLEPAMRQLEPRPVGPATSPSE